jgi:mxaL protein
VERIRDVIDLRFLLLLLAALCASIALQRPHLVLAEPVHRYVFVLDITESMNVADAGTPEAPMTRIAFAKRAVADALTRLSCGSEAGLALFAERRALLLFAPVEVCAHYGVIASMLDRIDWRLAWRGGSEIAHGLDSGIRMAHALGPETRLVFITDGHEAPPVHPQLRMHLDDAAGQTAGLIAGVGGDRPVPIPALDEEGHLTGYWQADQVQQVDSYSLGRGGSESSEPMTGVDTGDVQTRIAQGTEHLSFLHESYLEQLAAEARLDYRRLRAPRALGEVLLQRRYAHSKEVSTDLGMPLALAALVFCAAAASTGLLGRRHRNEGVLKRFLRGSSHSPVRSHDPL